MVIHWLEKKNGIKNKGGEIKEKKRIKCRGHIRSLMMTSLEPLKRTRQDKFLDTLKGNH